MFYKSIRAYKLRDVFPYGISFGDLKEKMEDKKFQPIHETQSFTYGWTEPAQGIACTDNDEGGIYELFEVDGRKYIALCLKTESKVMPPAAIKEAVNKKVDEIEKQQGRKVLRKEKLQIKDDIIAEKLPAALTLTALINGYIDIENGMMVIESSSSSKAEMMLNYMRETVGSFRVIPIHANTGFSSIMGAWYLSRNDEFMGNVTLGEEIELTNLEVKSQKAKFSGVYDGAMVEKLLQSNYLITKIGLVFRDTTFTLDKELAIKKLKLSMSGDTEEVEDMYARWKADFILQADIFGNLLKAAMQSFMQVTEGGEEQTEMLLSGG